MGHVTRADFHLFRWYLWCSPFQVLPVVVESCSIYQTTRLDLFLTTPKFQTGLTTSDHPGTPNKPQVVESAISKSQTGPQYRVTYHSTSFSSLINIQYDLAVWPHVKLDQKLSKPDRSIILFSHHSGFFILLLSAVRSLVRFKQDQEF